MPLKIFWTPDGITLDSIRDKRLVDISDGDTPNIRMNVRMLSIDTPEKRPTGTVRNKDELQAMFQEVATWIETGDSPVNANLAIHLIPRLKRNDAVSQGKCAWADDRMLTGYEFRSCERLAALKKKLNGRSTLKRGEWFGWIHRYCADMSTATLYAPLDYCLVPPENRLFIWEKDVRRAVAELNLTPSVALVGI